MAEVGAGGPVEQFFQAGKILPQRKNKTANLIKLKSSQAPTIPVRYTCSFVLFLEACSLEEHKKLEFFIRVHFVVCHVLAKMEILRKLSWKKKSSGDCRLKGLGHQMDGLLLECTDNNILYLGESQLVFNISRCSSDFSFEKHTYTVSSGKCKTRLGL
jgi:hypothetical protein